MEKVYVITDDEQPIIVASSEEKAKLQLFDYMGYNPKELKDSLIYKGFNIHIYSEFEDDYIGSYTFDSYHPIFGNERTIDKFKLFCMYMDHLQK